MSSLAVEKRDQNQNLRNLRLAGKVPAVIYGHQKDPERISIQNTVLTKESSKRGCFSRVVTLELGDKKIDVLIKDIQLDPLTDLPIHVDFMSVKKDQTIRTLVQIDYRNAEKSPAIKKGGVLNIVKHDLEVRCSPYEIPQELVCDLSNLQTETAVTLSSLVLPGNVAPVHPERDNVLATVVAAEEEKEEVAKEETAAAPTTTTPAA